ncbi:hypothetical protein [Ekhidna sp. To15]|uniref:hypothetical protein n=1 Tax=Ekhidna sp. To15 TaxID=3395267 RepID=UPI003F523F6F
MKDHIDKQKDEFEIYPYDTDKGWEEISRKVSPSVQKRDPWKVAGIAACFACILASTIFFMNPQPQANNEIAELERYYNGEINQKITLVKGQLKDDRILQDLNTMDQAFAELKADLKDNVDNQEVITAMMENYQLKLQILEEIINELEKEKSEEVL